MKKLFISLVILSAVVAEARQLTLQEQQIGSDVKVSADVAKLCSQIFTAPSASECISLASLHARVMTTYLIRACQNHSFARAGNSFSLDERKALDCINAEASKINPDIKK